LQASAAFGALKMTIYGGECNASTEGDSRRLTDKVATGSVGQTVAQIQTAFNVVTSSCQNPTVERRVLAAGSERPGDREIDHA
jgi:hypothetical protein